MRAVNDRPGRLPRLGLAVGDPAGIGPELAVKLLADAEARAAADLLVVGDRRVLERAASISGLNLGDLVPPSDGERHQGSAIVDLGHLDPDNIPVGEATAEGGRFALENLTECLRLASAAQVDGVCFTPFNKAAMHLADPSYVDEIGYIAATLECDVSQAREFNVLDHLWNARVTSHVPLSAVPAMITAESVANAIRLTEAALKRAGILRPRLAVAALNPHAGDGGNFGHEDDEIIAPAIAAARSEGFEAAGPFPADTVFLRAIKGDYDAVVTMYHDQGQIAMKLLGFERGVTFLSGFPVPICTPAHGSAYDIAGRDAADLGASRAAIRLAAAMALSDSDPRFSQKGTVAGSQGDEASPT